MLALTLKQGLHTQNFDTNSSDGIHSMLFIHPSKKLKPSYNLYNYIFVLAICTFISGCQTLKPAKLDSLKDSNTGIQNAFRINGKIGFSYTDASNQKKRQTVFYAWVQKNDAYHIDLSGALGIGKTQIYGNSQSATLNTKNSKTGEKQQISANSPESLLYKVTKLQAPISDLPYWIMGKPTRNATANKYDAQNRLISSTSLNGTSNWQISLTYEDDTLTPSKLKVIQLPDQANTTVADKKDVTPSNRVIMTINHIN